MTTALVLVSSSTVGTQSRSACACRIREVTEDPWPSPVSSSPGNGPAEPLDLKWFTTKRNFSPLPYFFLKTWPMGSRALEKACPSWLWVPRARDSSTRITEAGL